MALDISVSHSLRYDFTAVTESSLGQPAVTALGYLDGQLFVAYDSESRSAKSRGGELLPLLAAKETAFLEGRAQEVAWGLKTIMGYNELIGPHTLQLSHGCELSNSGRFWRYSYDGEDFTAYDPATWAWGATLPEPERRRRQLVVGRRLSAVRAWLDHECVAALRSLLAAGLGGPAPVVAPRVVVTQQEDPEGSRTLRCRAFGFSPANITLTWLQDGKELTLDSGLKGTRPGGNKTYQSWAVVGILPEEELRYTCLVEHTALKRPISVAWSQRTRNETGESKSCPYFGALAHFPLMSQLEPLEEAPPPGSGSKCQLVEYTSADGKPHLIDLGTGIGTFLNNHTEFQCYYEMKEKDVLKSGVNSRKYVWLHKALDTSEVDRKEDEEEEEEEVSDS
ncbi:PREDICTED: HLA class I histocompatibility antigen, Cw-17 alpha chain-like [Chrysochloris asiatica]|uniref:HLA class I histocompatibility antigen, Cw-17 alpha chain-like n=1 Tax=Chrysochloris asiatica TaxID=185453 RepID=A0A9B0U926_CHRAS|nr:PREDICTED: HLA class I histocompatibility antigen, Cw-17 alpha chain-like [Chrysochloris asiatica]